MGRSARPARPWRPLALLVASAFFMENLDGTVISGGSGDSPVSGKIIQCVSQDVLLQNVVFNGLPAVFPFPHHAPSN